MSKHFNGLSPAESERLALLLEEMGEAQQAIGKILRHGYESRNPLDSREPGFNNRQALARELGDVLFAIELLKETDTPAHWIETARILKREKVGRWLHHNEMPIASWAESR